MVFHTDSIYQVILIIDIVGQMEDILSSYLKPLSQTLNRIITIVTIFIALWFWYTGSVYSADLIISEFFYNQDDIRIEISNIWPTDFSGDIQIDGLWSSYYKNLSLPAFSGIILLWNTLNNVDLSAIWSYETNAGFVINSWDIDIKLRINWSIWDEVWLDIVKLWHILTSWVSYQSVYDGGAWVDWRSITRQNMTDAAIANPWIIVQNGDIKFDFVDPIWTIKHRDIQIVEIRPSSWNCMNEFIKIRSNIYYSGLVGFYWLGTSTATISYYLNLTPWEELVIVDDISGLMPWPSILVWPTITLTNGGEQLKVIISWDIIDDVIYSSLQWISSLFYTSMSGSSRLFKTNWPWTPANKCNQVNFTWGVWLCDIDVTPNYLGTGAYLLDASIGWQYKHLCSTGSVRILNGATWNLDSCSAAFSTLLGTNKVEFLQYSGSEIICRDVYLFASSYDVWYVNQYYCPIDKVPSSTWSASTDSLQCSENNLSYMGNCHIQYQWSTLGFFANYNFNFIANIEWKNIQNTNKQYECTWDMGDGNILYECNPSGHRYVDPGVYVISLTIRDNFYHGYCKTSSFVNYPLKTITDASHTNYFDLYNYVVEFCSEHNLKDNDTTSFIENKIIWSFCDEFYASWFIKSNIILPYMGDLTLVISSALPNPIGSDSIYEKITLQNIGQHNVKLDGLSVQIWSKKIALSWVLDSYNTKDIIWGLGLVNNGMCLYLKQSHIIIDEFCYESVKEWEIITLTWLRQNMTWEISDNIDDIEYATWHDLDNVWQEIIDMLWLEDIVGEVWEDQYIEKDITSLLTSVKLVQEMYTICFESGALLHCKIQTPSKKSKPKSTKKSLSTADKYKIESTIYKNKYYLYKNFSNYLLRQLSLRYPFISEDKTIKSYYELVDKMDKKIWSWYIYTSKDNRSYRYLNNFKQTIDESQHISIADILYPWIVQYTQEIKMYYINKELINQIKNIK